MEKVTTVDTTTENSENDEVQARAAEQTNREKIESYCQQKGYEVLSLEYDKSEKHWKVVLTNRESLRPHGLGNDFYVKPDEVDNMQF